MSQHATKVWIRFQSSKTGKTDHPSLQNTRTVTIPKTKTSSHEFTVHSLLYAVQAQKTPIDRHADVLETNRSPWFCRNPSTSHLHKQKLHSPNDKLTKKILTAKQGALHKTLKIVCVSFVCFVSFVSFRLKLRFHMTAFHTLAT